MTVPSDLFTLLLAAYERHLAERNPKADPAEADLYHLNPFIAFCRKYLAVDNPVVAYGSSLGTTVLTLTDRQAFPLVAVQTPPAGGSIPDGAIPVTGFLQNSMLPPDTSIPVTKGNLNHPR